MQTDISLCWKIVYLLPVLPVYLIIYTNGYTVTYYYFMDDKPMTFLKTIAGIIFYTCTLATIICHTISMVASPGYVDQNLVKHVDIDITVKNGLHCKKCEKPRPERAHHCKKCEKCILKMDHHCPWIANCVGFFNQKAFYLFLFYAVVGDLVGFICLLNKILDPSFYNMVITPKIRIDYRTEFLFLEVIKALKDPLLIIVGACMNMVMAIAIGVLLGYQTYLILNNMTSIESNKLEKVEFSPYYHKDKMLLFKSVMGDSIPSWFIPTFRPNIYNNGYSYFLPGKEDSTMLKEPTK
jgi:hypothetical protein